MPRIALFNASRTRVTNVIMGALADFPGGRVVADHEACGPGSEYDAATDTFPVPAPAPAPQALDEAALIDLCQSAGGMTDAQLVAAFNDANLAAFWIKLRAASTILPADQRTIAGLDAVEMLGYLPEGAAAVLAAWPTA